jgi:hypothetical protein
VGALGWFETASERLRKGVQLWIMSTPLYLPQKMGYLRSTWPGLNPREVVVFNSWLLLHYNEYTAMDFNVRIGNGSDPLPTMTDPEKVQWKMNTQKRIDCLAYKDSQAEIIEVKDRAEIRVVGQISMYSILWLQDNPGALKPVLRIVANRADSDVLFTAAASGIRVDLVEADFSGLSKKTAPTV